jgi:dTDP-4-amino-4,6-dideoxygalactose transaminase
MPSCTAALCLAQLEIISEQVEHIDRMVRRLSAAVDAIPGCQSTPIPDYQGVYSAWMFGFSLDPEQFRCTPAEFAGQMVEAGIPGASLAEYYLLPEACDFLREYAAAERYPYSRPPASRQYVYGRDSTPHARDYLRRWIRWSTFCEKYTEADCDHAAAIVAEIAEANRV